jgi:capsular polysaccharide biosynthesis protein
MSLSGTGSGGTVRPDSSWRSQKLFYLAVFAVSGVAVYRWGLATAQPPQPSGSCTSTATIHLRDGTPAAAEPEKIRQQITSKENIYRAIRRLGLATPPPPDEAPQATATRVTEEVSRDLQVAADAGTPPGELAVSITYTHDSAQYSAQLANTLAECFAEDCRAEWQRQSEGAYDAARKATDRAQQEFLQANARLQEFFEQHLTAAQPEQPAKTADAKRQQTDKDPPDSAHAQQPQPHTPSAAPPPDQPSVGAAPPGESSDGIDLRQRLAELKRRRAELLVDRTPLHPEVRETELRITAVERQLAVTPEEVSTKLPDDAGATGVTPAPQGGDGTGDTNTAQVPPAGNHAQTARTFQTLKQAADEATAAYLKAVEQERKVWREHQRQPRIELDLAQPGQPRVPLAPPRLALLLTALAAGLTMAGGVVMISAGGAVQFPLTSVEQVRNALAVPVVGIIQETHPTGQPATVPRRPHLMRWILMVGGLSLIAGCLGLLWRAWGG